MGEIEIIKSKVIIHIYGGVVKKPRRIVLGDVEHVKARTLMRHLVRLRKGALYVNALGVWASISKEELTRAISRYGGRRSAGFIITKIMEERAGIKEPAQLPPRAGEGGGAGQKDGGSGEGGSASDSQQKSSDRRQPACESANSADAARADACGAAAQQTETAPSGGGGCGDAPRPEPGAEHGDRDPEQGNDQGAPAKGGRNSREPCLFDPAGLVPETGAEPNATAANKARTSAGTTQEAAQGADDQQRDGEEPEAGVGKVVSQRPIFKRDNALEDGFVYSEQYISELSLKAETYCSEKRENEIKYINARVLFKQNTRKKRGPSDAAFARLDLSRFAEGRRNNELARELRKLIVETGVTGDVTPRIDPGKLVREMVTKRYNLSLAKREEAEPNRFVFSADVSGSCAAHIEDYLATAVSLYKEFPSHVVIILHVNGDTSEILDKGTIEIVRTRRPFDEAVKALKGRVRFIIDFGDDDASVEYQRIALAGVKLLRCNNYCSSYGKPLLDKETRVPNMMMFTRAADSDDLLHILRNRRARKFLRGG